MTCSNGYRAINPGEGDLEKRTWLHVFPVLELFDKLVVAWWLFNLLFRHDIYFQVQVTYP